MSGTRGVPMFSFASREEHLRQRAARGWTEDEDVLVCIVEIDRLRAEARAAPDPAPLDVERLRKAAERIAALTEDDVRDYEQGLCFFCGAGHVVVPGQRGGVTGVRSKTPVHEADCSYIALRAALASEDRPMTIGTASTQTFCSRCNHPMHWKVCGVERDGLPSSCRCRNDAALEEPTPEEPTPPSKPAWVGVPDANGDIHCSRLAPQRCMWLEGHYGGCATP